MPPQGTLWQSSSSQVAGKWEGSVAYLLEDEALGAAVCADSQIPAVIEVDGLFYPSCITTGVFYAPPFAPGMLDFLQFPQDWSTLPPG